MPNILYTLLAIFAIAQLGACSSSPSSTKLPNASEQDFESQGLVILVDTIVPEMTTLSIDGCRVDATLDEVEVLRAYHDETNFVWRSVLCVVRIENTSSDTWILSRRDIKALLRRAIVMQDDTGQAWRFARTLLPHGGDPCYNVPCMKNSLKTVVIHLLNSRMAPAGDSLPEIVYPKHINFQIAQAAAIRGRRISQSGVADRPVLLQVSGSGVAKLSPYGLDLIAN